MVPAKTHRPSTIAGSPDIRRERAFRGIAMPRSWRYAGGKRDLRLDLLRGFAAFAMIVDHIGGNSSWFYWVTGGDRFFISAAEVFVLISGLVMGIVYGGVMIKQGIIAGTKKALCRSATLYALTILLTFSFAPLSALLSVPWAPHLARSDMLPWAFEVVTLHRTFHLVDIPLLYAMLVLFAAPVLVAMVRGWTWPVLALSSAVWLLWQISPQHDQLPWSIAGNEVFHIAAWQVIFVVGLAAGFHWRALQRRLAGLSPAAICAGAGAMLAAAVFLMVTQQHPGGLLPPGSAISEQLNGKADVRFLRLVVLAVFFAFSFSLMTLIWAPLERALGWLLMPMGQHALTAYTLHLFVVLAAARLLPAGGATRNTLIEGLGVLIVWAIIVVNPPMPSWASTKPAWRLLAASARGLRELSLGRAGRRAWTGLAAAGASLAMLSSAFALRPGPAGLLAPVRDRLPASPVAAAVVPPDVPAGATTMPTPVPAPAAGSSAGYGGEAYVAPLLGQVQWRTIQSSTLGVTLPYIVYLPPGYSDDNSRRYPVLYMLHGLTNDTLKAQGGAVIEWLAYGLPNEADRLIRSGDIAPMIIVLPDGEDSYWVDHADGGPQWGTYMARDVVSEIDSQFRTIPDLKARAIGGNSMGAHGALQLALNYPDVFGVVGAHSPSLHREDTIPAYFGDEAYFRAHDPVDLVREKADVARGLRIYLDDGSADTMWLASAVAFHQELLDMAVPHEFRILPGPHEDGYWTANVGAYLQFYNAALQH